VGGAQFVTYTAPSTNLGLLQGVITNTSFNKTMEVGADNPNPVIQLIVDTTRTIQATVSGSSIGFDDSNPSPWHSPCSLFLSFLGRERWNLCVGGPSGIELRLSHAERLSGYDDQTVKIFTIRWPTNPHLFFRRQRMDGNHFDGQSGPGVRLAPPGFNGVPTYLGRDNSGTVGFATANDNTSHAALVSFAIFQRSNHHNIKYKSQSNPPVPTSGSTILRRPFLTPDGQVTLQLIAH